MRLRARSGTHWLDDRVRVLLQRTEGEILGLRTSRELRAGRWRQVVEWETLRDRPGFLIAERDGMSVHEERWRPRGDSATLPEHLPAARYAVRSTQLRKRRRRSAYRGNRSGERVGSALALRQVAALPNGYLLPGAVDVNGDGIAELRQMSYGRQRTYNTVDFYQQEEA